MVIILNKLCFSVLDNTMYQIFFLIIRPEKYSKQLFFPLNFALVPQQWNLGTNLFSWLKTGKFTNFH